MIVSQLCVWFTCDECRREHNTGGESIEDAATDVPDGWLVNLATERVVCDVCSAKIDAAWVALSTTSSGES